MSEGGDVEYQALGLITQLGSALLLVVTVVIGVYGLGRSYRGRDRKLTTTGKRMAAAMIVAGVASASVALLDNHLSARQAEEEASAQEARFAREMFALGGLTGSLRALQADMSGSLEAQSALFDAAQSNLAASETLQDQTTANTREILLEVYEGSNRISADTVTLSIAWSCLLSEMRKIDPFDIRSVSLAVTSPSGANLSLTSDSFSPTGTTQLFGGFTGELGAFSSFDGWRDARVSIRVLAVDEIRSLDQFQEDLRTQSERRQFGSCPISAELMLNDRVVLKASGDLRETEQVSGMVAELNDVPVDNRLLPRFPH